MPQNRSTVAIYAYWKPVKKRIFNIIRDGIASSCRVKCILRESESIVWRSYFLSEIGQCMVHMQPRLPTGA